MPHGLPPLFLTPPARPWWHSRTLWFNAFAAALLAAEASFSLLQPLLPVNAFAAVSFVLVVVNAALRLVTTQPVQLGAAPGTAEILQRGPYG